MHIVLVEPEIPPNTGSIARLCVSTGCSLHLVKPLGYEITDRHLRRAGLDYWEYLDLTVHENFDSVLKLRGDAPMYLATAHAERPYTEVAYGEDDWLVFGCETCGLPDDLVVRFPDAGVRIPMWGPSRCLNLSNAVSVVVFEALRQVRKEAFYGPAAAGPSPASIR
ncbi:MAG: tRNA (cytidine(34)-2'-O)-methyltransferase [Leptospirillia bacterium]